MTWLGPLRHALLFGLIALMAAGCSPTSNNSLDEEKDPHFITGKNKVNSYDYVGAVDAFEKALESNPRSASAHFEIGLLYYQRLNDHAAAIYHFDKFLSLNPKHPRAETVKQFIISSKQELARTVSLGPINQQVQKELDRLVSTNGVLLAENNKLRDHVQQLQAEVSNLRNAPRPPAQAAPPPAVTPAPIVGSPLALKSAPPAATNAGTVPKAQPRVDSLAPQPGSLTGRTRTQPAVTNAPVKPVAPALKTYTVVAGDTPAKIGRKYGVSIDRILAANPGLDPRKLKVGMVIKVP